MAWIVERKEKRLVALPTKLLSSKQVKALASQVALKILGLLASQPAYPLQLARELGLHEQKIYYYIRKLEKAKLVRVVGQVGKRGVQAKIYAAEPSLTLAFKDFEQVSKILFLDEEKQEFLRPFVDDGKLNCLVIVGSPEPHGLSRARARDVVWGMNFGLWLGSFLSFLPSEAVRLDTETRSEDLKNNLMLIGGPGVNSVTAKVNPKLPIRFRLLPGSRNYYSDIYSTLSRRSYGERCGIIVKTKNPFDSSKQILVLAGLRAVGTRTAVLTLLQNLSQVLKGNKFDPRVQAKVVEGVDLDADGVIDKVEFKE